MADAQTDDPALRPLTAFNNADSTTAPKQDDDDPALHSLTAFNPNAGVTPYTPAPSWQASDLPKGLAAGFHTGLGAPLAELTGQTDEAQAEREAGAQSEASMTPGASQTTPVWLAEQAAPAAAMIGPSLIPGVGPALGALAGAAISGGGAISQNKGAIEQTNDNDLKDSNPTYAADRASGLTEAQAKAKLGSSMALSVGIPSAVLGGIAGGAGGAEIGGFLKMGVGDAEAAALTGSGLTRRVTGRGAEAIVGAGRGLAEQGLPGAGQEAISKHAEAQEGVGGEATGSDILAAGVGQGLFGAAVAGGAGWLHSGVHRDSTQTGGAAHVDRTPAEQIATEYKGKQGLAASPADTPASAAAAEPSVPTAANKDVGPAETAALTPGVTKPPDTSVEQPKVVQPEAPPSQINAEAPPAGDTTGEPSPPQNIADASPTPAPAPPVEDAGALTPESAASLAEQHAALLDPANPREAMVYPKGSQPIEITDKSRFGQAKLPDGRIVQFDKAGDSGFSVAKVRQYAKDDRLNEALGLGPVNKTEALSRTLAGEPGAVVTERTPDGTEVKGAVGTTATVPDQVAALEATKTPGNVVQAETPEANHADQIARVAQEAQPQAEVVQPQVVEPNPVGKLTTTPFGPGRQVLPDISPEGIRARDAAVADEAQRAQTVAEQLRAREAAKQEAVVAKRVHTAKADQVKVANDNIGAQRIVDKYPAPERLDTIKRPTEIYDRAKAMVKEAKAAGIKIPDAFPEGHPHSPAMLKLREAADLTSKSTPKWDAYARFIDREHMIDAGRGDEAFAARRNEGALGLGSPEGAAETVREGQIDETEKPEDIREAPEHEVVHETPAEHAGGGGEGEEQPTAARERPKVVEAAEEGKHFTAGKAATGFQVAKVKSRAIKRQELEPDHETVMATNSEGNPVAVKAQRSTTAEDAINEHFDPKKYSPEMRPMMERLKDAVTRVAGDTPVHYISHDDMLSLGEQARGLYDTGNDHILLNADKITPDTALHEAFHAATAKALAADPELQGLMGRLQDEMGVKGDSEEFLTRLMTEADMQAKFKSSKISPELARDIGIPKWQRATMWQGALNLFRRALGLGPRDVSAVEAAMALSEKAMWKRDPGMAMEAGARSLGLRFQKLGDDAPPDEQVKAMGADAQDAIQKPSSFWDNDRVQAAKSGIGEKFTNAYIKSAFTDVLRIDNEHLFGEKTEANPMRRAQEGLLKQGHMIQNMLSGHNDLMQRMADMKRENPDGLDRIVSLLSESHDFNVHPDDELGVGRNDYIKPDRKTGEFGIDSNAEHHEAILAHDRLSKDFNDSKPEEQKLFRDMRDTLMEEGQKTVKANIETFTQGVKDNFERDEKLQEALKTAEANRTPSEIKRVERYEAVTKVLNGDKLTEGDQHDTYNDDPHIKTIRDLRGMLKQEGPYFPGTRKGGWVVNAEHELPEAPNALSMKGNEVTFGSEKDAYDYRQKLVEKSLPSDMEKVSEPISSDQKPGQGKEQYKVTVQNKHSSAVNSIHEARTLGESLKQMGLKNVTEPMLREKNESVDYGLHGGTLRAMDHAVDALTHLSKEEKDSLKEANEQASLGLMKGNRMNRGLLKNNRVRGANADPVLSMHDYLANSARSQARSKTLPDIDKAFREMRDVARDRQDENTPKRGMLVQEMENRAQHFGKEGFTGQMSPTLQKITTLAYLKDMMAPVHYALDLTHPYLQSIPQMAGRHGFGLAHTTYAKTVGDMGGGGVLGKGVKGVFGALKGSDHTPTDLMTGIRDSLVRNGATADELRAFDVGRETPHLGSIVTDFSKSYDRTGGLDKAASYLQGIGNEMSHAVDAVNRVGTYMTAYRLERAKMGKAGTLAENVAHHAQAVRYAKDTVSQTQGIYSASNRASFMRNPYVRAAMQFRSVPMMVYRLLAKNMYNAIRGETPEVRRAAVISLVSTMGTTAALAGATSGVPEPIRLAVEMGHALHINDSWQDYQDKARRYTDAHMGKFGSRLIMDGVLGAAGLNAGNRIGLQDLMIKDQALQSPKDFALEMAGSPFGYGVNDLEGVNDMLGGNYKQAIPKLLPIRLLSDVAKAYIENQGGKQAGHGQPNMKPLDPFETFIKAVGGTPTREALYGQESSLLKEANTEKKAALQRAIGGNRSAVTAWNEGHPRDRITQAQVLRARQTNKAETPKQRAIEEEYSVYQ
jgi:hypothetical protein